MGDAFANFDLVESFSRIHLEKSTYPQQNWKEAVDMIMEEEPNAKVKLALRRWKVGSATDMADVVLAPDFDAKTMCFRFSLRAFKGEELEEKLIAALADDPAMKAYIGRAMANVLRTMN